MILALLSSFARAYFAVHLLGIFAGPHHTLLGQLEAGKTRRSSHLSKILDSHT